MQMKEILHEKLYQSATIGLQYDAIEHHLILCQNLSSFCLTTFISAALLIKDQYFYEQISQPTLHLIC